MKANNYEAVGYFVTEAMSTPVVPHISQSSGDFVVIDTVLQDCDNQNRNRRVYPLEVMIEALQSPFISERLNTRSWHGEANHPITDNIKRMAELDHSNISHTVLSYNVVGNRIEGSVETAPTVRGQEMCGFIRRGTKVAFSMRGFAKAVAAKPRPGVAEGGQIILRPLNLRYYDWVTNPSHACAFMKGIKESTMIDKQGAVIELSESQVVNFLTENSGIFNELESLFGVDAAKAGHVSLHNNGRTMKITNESESLIVKVEDYVAKKLYNIL